MKFTRNALALLLAGGAIGAAAPAFAKGNADIESIRSEIRAMKQSYESRIEALEARLRASEAALNAAKADAPTRVSASAGGSATAAAGSSSARSNAFNPDISLILSGTYASLSQDPEAFRIQGFMPEAHSEHHNKRGFGLQESELAFRANIDPLFSGTLLLAVTPDHEVEVEEAFFDSTGFIDGVSLRGGRFLSSLGYMNKQHPHAWDFVGAPLPYQAFLAGQYRSEGVGLRWLAPTEQFIELGVEVGNGGSFPGTDRQNNGIGSTVAFAHVGGDIGASSSWRAGLSYLDTRAKDRHYHDTDSTDTEVYNVFDGKSRLWVADVVYKWAPNGNSKQTNLKLQAEYFQRKENGSLIYDAENQSMGASSPLAYKSKQSGFYVQGVYQFMPKWRVGLRHEQLDSGSHNINLDGTGLSQADFRMLDEYKPKRSSIMFDYSYSEYSRFRLQYTEDKSRPEATDQQIFLQYVMSLGAHGAHGF